MQDDSSRVEKMTIRAVRVTAPGIPADTPDLFDYLFPYPGRSFW